MPLSVVVGASGSGKTTFLNDVHASHRCTYIRQYHSIRPYLTVSRIPNFDPTLLPYWDIYVREGKDATIQVGGTMAGEFTPGLSGGQRKLMLFELIYQRTKDQKGLIIVLDEPFAGVTDDFVPFITKRLNEMKYSQNLLVVTNDHVKALTDLADNTITVSAIDRTKVKVNDHEGIDRTVALQALSLGENYKNVAGKSDLKFFWNIEVSSNKALMTIGVSTLIFFSLFIATYWDSQPGTEALVWIGGGILTYFAIQPYILSLTDWRNINKEEADALLHSSVNQNKFLKLMLAILLCTIIDFVFFGSVNLVIDVFRSWYYAYAIFMDIVSLTLPMILVSLYSHMPFETVQIVGTAPFLMMIFFSTTFSPGSGVEGLKALRYLFPRFYIWCELPGVQMEMEGCPDTRAMNMLYMFLSANFFNSLFLAIVYAGKVKKRKQKAEAQKRRTEIARTPAFTALQAELFSDNSRLSRKFSQKILDIPADSLSTSTEGEAEVKFEKEDV